MTDNPCPTGCGRQHRTGQLMCPPCWGEVPKHLQNDVYRTWRAWSRDMGDVDRMAAYEAARNAALAAVA